MVFCYWKQGEETQKVILSFEKTMDHLSLQVSYLHSKVIVPSEEIFTTTPGYLQVYKSKADAIARAYRQRVLPEWDKMKRMYRLYQENWFNLTGIAPGMDKQGTKIDRSYKHCAWWMHNMLRVELQELEQKIERSIEELGRFESPINILQQTIAT